MYMYMCTTLLTVCTSIEYCCEITIDRPMCVQTPPPFLALKKIKFHIVNKIHVKHNIPRTPFFACV